MTASALSLGTLLRHLIETLDGAVEQTYRDDGLAYRPRYTPIVLALIAIGPASIRTISHHAGLTHSAVSQTVSQMAKDGLVELRPGADARERIVALSAAAEAMLPALRRHWAATALAADGLDRELSAPLSRVAAEAIQALERVPFGDRIRQARPDA